MVNAEETRPRRDAQRNLASLLAAAKAVFASSGVDAPAKEITDRAGVGVGTLYRHFPKRSDLIAAVLQQEVDACVVAASGRSGSPEPFAALTEWIDVYVDFVATKQGLAAALHSPDPAYEGLMDALIRPLAEAADGMLDRARGDGSVRSELTGRELLVGIALLCQGVPGEPREFNRRLVAVFVDGLRADPRAVAR